jgi:hypothetical protein
MNLRRPRRAIEALRLGGHQLVIGDIFDGNAFQLCMFVLADLVAAKPVLLTTGAPIAWLASLSLVLTVMYVGFVGLLRTAG